MKKKINNGEVFIWNELPALAVDKGGKKYAAIFTNLNGEFSILRIPFEEIDDKCHYDQAKKIGAFDCLVSEKNKMSDEFTVILSLTEKCNSMCRYCFLDAKRNGKDLTMEMLYSGIDFAINNALGRPITFAAFGGEPSVNFSLLAEMVNYIKQKCCENNSLKAKFAITTNGIMDEKTLNLLIENNFKISLSMDGLKEVQDFQRPLSNGKSSYDIVISNLKRFIQSNLDLKIRATVTKFSVSKMADTVSELAKYGVKKIHFEPVTPGGRGCNSEDLLSPPNSEEFVDNLVKAIEVGAGVGVDVICFPYMNMLVAPIVFCDGRIQNRLVISPAGVLSSCVEVQDPNHPLFDSLGLGYFDNKTKQLVITAEERRTAIRGCNAIKDENRNCNNCPFVFFCGGGCPTRNYRGTGMSNRVDLYRCKIIKGIMPYILNKFYNSTFCD